MRLEQQQERMRLAELTSEVSALRADAKQARLAAAALEDAADGAGRPAMLGEVHAGYPNHYTPGGGGGGGGEGGGGGGGEEGSVLEQGRVARRAERAEERARVAEAAIEGLEATRSRLERQVTEEQGRARQQQQRAAALEEQAEM